MNLSKHQRAFILTSLIFLSSLSLTFSASNIVAKVAGQSITKSDVDYEMSLQASADDTVGLDSLSAEKKILDNIINKKILILEANAEKIEPPSTVIDEQIQNRMMVFGGDPAKFKQALKKEGMNEKQLRQQLEDEYRVTGLLQRNVYSYLTPITLKDAQKYYQEHPDKYSTPDTVRIRHIFIALNQNTTADAKAAKLKKAEEALAKIKSGEDFAQVAHDYSESPTASNGGDIGRPIRKGELNTFPEVEKVAFSLDSGQVSDIIRSNYGFHIIKVENKILGHLKPFELVKSEVLDEMTKQRAKDRYNQWFQQVKSKYKIEIFPENL